LGPTWNGRPALDQAKGWHQARGCQDTDRSLVLIGDLVGTDLLGTDLLRTETWIAQQHRYQAVAAGGASGLTGVTVDNHGARLGSTPDSHLEDCADAGSRPPVAGGLNDWPAEGWAGNGLDPIGCGAPPAGNSFHLVLEHLLTIDLHLPGKIHMPELANLRCALHIEAGQVPTVTAAQATALIRQARRHTCLCGRTHRQTLTEPK